MICRVKLATSLVSRDEECRQLRSELRVDGPPTLYDNLQTYPQEELYGFLDKRHEYLRAALPKLARVLDTQRHMETCRAQIRSIQVMKEQDDEAVRAQNEGSSKLCVVCLTEPKTHATVGGKRTKRAPPTRNRINAHAHTLFSLYCDVRVSPQDLPVWPLELLP